VEHWREAACWPDRRCWPEAAKGHEREANKRRRPRRSHVRLLRECWKVAGKLESCWEAQSLGPCII
jgi:hypothetical protein